MASGEREVMAMAELGNRAWVVDRGTVRAPRRAGIGHGRPILEDLFPNPLSDRAIPVGDLGLRARGQTSSSRQAPGAHAPRNGAAGPSARAGVARRPGHRPAVRLIRGTLPGTLRPDFGG